MLASGVREGPLGTDNDALDAEFLASIAKDSVCDAIGQMFDDLRSTAETSFVLISTSGTVFARFPFCWSSDNGGALALRFSEDSA